MPIRLLTAIRIAGVAQPAETIVTLTPAQEADLVADGFAAWSGADLSAAWQTAPSIFRLRLTGTGTVQVDARNALGQETLATNVYTLSSETNRVEFPFLGADATQMRISTTGSARYEVI